MSDISWPTLHLMRSMGFTQEDLEANRTGRLTDKQRKWFKKQDLESVQHVSGIIRKGFDRSRNGDDHYIDCEGRRFRVTAFLYEIFLDGKRYILHYTSYGLVTAEYDDVSLGDMYPNMRLQDALRFDEEDLELNHKRQLSPTQYERYRNRSNVMLMIVLPLFIIPVVLIKDISPTDTIGLQRQLIGGTVIFFAVVALYFVLHSRRALSAGSLGILRGVVTDPNTNPAISGTGTILVNGEQSFYLGQRASAFILGETYTIYFVPYHTLFFDHFSPVVAAEHQPLSNPVAEK